MTNVCTECEKEFETKRKSKTGICKSCRDKANYQKSKSYILAHQKEPKEYNKDKISKYGKEYRERNKDKIAVRKKDYYANNKIKLGNLHKNWRKANPEKAANRINKWRKTHPEKARMHDRIRRARRLLAEGFYDFQELFNLIDYYNYSCVYCGKDLSEEYHLDHIIPLSKGGSNWIHNIQPLCAHCNLSKQAKLPWIFEEEIGFERDPDFWCNHSLYTPPRCTTYTIEEIEAILTCGSST